MEEKIAFINGYCPLQDDDVTIRVRCSLYGAIGAPAYASVKENMCELYSDCPHEKNCPIENQTLLWNEL